MPDVQSDAFESHAEMKRSLEDERVRAKINKSLVSYDSSSGNSDSGDEIELASLSRTENKSKGESYSTSNSGQGQLSTFLPQYVPGELGEKEMADNTSMVNRLEEFVLAASKMAVLIPAQSLCKRLYGEDAMSTSKVKQLIEEQKKVAMKGNNTSWIADSEFWTGYARATRTGFVAEKPSKIFWGGVDQANQNAPSSSSGKPSKEPRRSGRLAAEAAKQDVSIASLRKESTVTAPVGNVSLGTDNIPCPVPGCSERVARVKTHVSQKHLPKIYCTIDEAGDFADEYLHRTRAVGLMWLAKCILGTDSIDNLIDYVNQTGINEIVSDAAYISDVEQKAMRFLCLKQKWPLPNTFVLFPQLNSKAALIHWKVLLYLREKLTTKERIEFKVNGDSWYSELGYQPPPKHNSSNVDPLGIQRPREQRENSGEEEERKQHGRFSNRNASRSPVRLSREERHEIRVRERQEKRRIERQRGSPPQRESTPPDQRFRRSYSIERRRSAERRHSAERRSAERRRSTERRGRNDEDDEDDDMYSLCPAEGCDQRSTRIRKHAHEEHIPKLYDTNVRVVDDRRNHYLQSRRAAGLRTLALWITEKEDLHELVEFVNTTGRFKCCLRRFKVTENDHRSMRRLCHQQGWEVQNSFELYPNLNSPAALIYWRVILWLMDSLSDEQRRSFMYGEMDEDDW